MRNKLLSFSNYVLSIIYKNFENFKNKKQHRLVQIY